MPDVSLLMYNAQSNCKNSHASFICATVAPCLFSLFSITPFTSTISDSFMVRSSSFLQRKPIASTNFLIYYRKKKYGESLVILTFQIWGLIQLKAWCSEVEQVAVLKSDLGGDHIGGSWPKRVYPLLESVPRGVRLQVDSEYELKH